MLIAASEMHRSASSRRLKLSHCCCIQRCGCSDPEQTYAAMKRTLKAGVSLSWLQILSLHSQHTIAHDLLVLMHDARLQSVWKLVCSVQAAIIKRRALLLRHMCIQLCLITMLSCSAHKSRPDRRQRCPPDAAVLAALHRVLPPGSHAGAPILLPAIGCTWRPCWLTSTCWQANIPVWSACLPRSWVACHDMELPA